MPMPTYIFHRNKRQLSLKSFWRIPPNRTTSKTYLWINRMHTFKHLTRQKDICFNFHFVHRWIFHCIKFRKLRWHRSISILWRGHQLRANKPLRCQSISYSCIFFPRLIFLLNLNFTDSRSLEQRGIEKKQTCFHFKVLHQIDVLSGL